jgi:hypothetical protein
VKLFFAAPVAGLFHNAIIAISWLFKAARDSRSRTIWRSGIAATVGDWAGPCGSRPNTRAPTCGLWPGTWPAGPAEAGHYVLCLTVRLKPDTTPSRAPLA